MTETAVARSRSRTLRGSTSAWRRHSANRLRTGASATSQAGGGRPPQGRMSCTSPGWSATTSSRRTMMLGLSPSQDSRSELTSSQPEAGAARARPVLQDARGQAAVTDCRLSARPDEKLRYKASVTAAACSYIGWDYRLVGEPDPVWAANLRWLAGYRHPRFGEEHFEELLVSLFASARNRSARPGKWVIPSASSQCCFISLGAAA